MTIFTNNILVLLTMVTRNESILSYPICYQLFDSLSKHTNIYCVGLIYHTPHTTSLHIGTRNRFDKLFWNKRTWPFRTALASNERLLYRDYEYAVPASVSG